MTSLDTACMTEQAIDEYLSDYTMDGDSEFHMPTDAERLLIKDAIMGLLVDQNFLAAFAPLAEPELRAGIALQLREIERLRMQVKQADEMRAYGDAREAAATERAAKLCEEVNDTTGECPELALYCADAIRGS